MNGEGYTERVFLTGADPLSVGFEKMIRILNLVRKYFPYVAVWHRMHLSAVCKNTVFTN